MADNPYINKVQMADGTVLMDLTEDTLTAEHMLAGVIGHSSSGATTIGTIPTYNGEYLTTNNQS